MRKNAQALAHVTNVEDLRRIAERKVPRMFYDYVDSGAWSESTYRWNESEMQQIRLRQRIGIDVGKRSTRSRMLGEEVAMPMAIGPTGLAGMMAADGEIFGARAAKAFGVPFTLSTMSICSLEDIAEHTGRHPFWFQLYVFKDREFTEQLVERAQKANVSALQITLDVPLLAQRHKDIKNGISTPPRLTLRNLIGMAARPSWCMGMLGSNRRQLGNIAGHVKGVTDMASLSLWTAKQIDPTLCWDDVEWLRQVWRGKLVLKGILDPEDARRAVDCGADALIVSNHGGRQLDGAPSSIEALPAVVAAVGADAEVWMDGGIRSGQDVFRAKALGATGTLIGRSFLYGLGAYGEAGVTRVLQLMQRELSLTMALCGCTSVHEIDRKTLWLHE